MPPKQARDNASNPAKPFMPTLAPGRNVKSPITPRLAVQHLNSTTPVARSARSNTPSSVRSPGVKEDLATPAKAFIAANVTPRSTSRKSRVDSNHTTPSGTPNGTRSSSTVDFGGSFGRQNSTPSFGLGILGSGRKSRPTSVVGGMNGTVSPGLAPQPMFFHANEVPQPSPELLPSAGRPQVFLHANGEHEESLRPLSHPSPPLSSVSTSTRTKQSKFFRADGSADDDIPPVPSLPSPSVQNNVPQFFQNAPAFRPPSPNKDNFHLSYRKGASQIMRPDTRPKAISILPPASFDMPRQRSTSGGTPKIGPHKRTSSLSSIESGASVRKPSLGALETCGLTPLQTILQVQTPPTSDPSSAPLANRFPFPIPEHGLPEDATPALPIRSRQASISSPAISAPPHSPTKGPGGWQPQLTEVIMNARVERKIQDLEISNSSLMAINKSLEKEVRRQNKELRRFRRLSRAGRLSGISVAQSVGTNDGDDEFESQPVELSVLEELSEEEDEEEEEEEDEESSDDSSSSGAGSLSASAIAEREERKLAKDSKRLQIDLAKHRELLVDSQKMNQSLKRCMAWTEMMIKDGRKALDYRPEAEIGGRVLDQDEHDDPVEEDDGQPRHSLLGSWSSVPMPALEALDGILGIDTSAPLTRRSWQSEDAGDSGIDVDSRHGSKFILDAISGALDLDPSPS